VHEIRGSRFFAPQRRSSEGTSSGARSGHGAGQALLSWPPRARSSAAANTGSPRRPRCRVGFKTLRTRGDLGDPELPVTEHLLQKGAKLASRQHSGQKNVFLTYSRCIPYRSFASILDASVLFEARSLRRSFFSKLVPFETLLAQSQQLHVYPRGAVSLPLVGGGRIICEEISVTSCQRRRLS
jgi:hypothetical protein